MTLHLLNPDENRHLYNVDDEAQVIPVIECDEEDYQHDPGHEHCDDPTCPCNANVIDSSLA